MSHNDKGKGRAPTETTPLLGASSSVLSSTSPDPEPRRRRRLGLHLFFISLAVSIVFLAVIFALLASSYARRLSSEDLRHALLVQGPYNVEILNSTQEVIVQISFRAGINAGSLIGVDSEPAGIFQKFSAIIGQWAIRQLGNISLDLSCMRLLSSNHPERQVLATLFLQPFVLPLVANPSGSDWLRNISTPVSISPASNSSLITSFLQDAWKDGNISFTAASTRINVDGTSGWRQIFHISLANISVDLNLRVPDLPGLPEPGSGKPLPPVAQLITLQRFELQTESEQLNLRALATAINPVPPSIQLAIPLLPFTVGIPADSGSVAIAAVQTEPFTSTHPNITIQLGGHILPLSSAASIPLSAFLSNYMSGLANIISISSPLYPTLTITSVFPPPQPRPQILQNVTIHNMKIRPGNTFHASGTVFARLVLPKGMKIDLNIKRILPDVLIFDGEVDDNLLPDPLPARAFGHIRPDDWVDAVCTPDTGKDSSVFTVSAEIVDVPLEVLPGREKEFSNFVSKVIFGTAVAGIVGTTAVDVIVPGLQVDGRGQARIVLPSLPFHGSVRIHKTNMLNAYIT